MRTPLSTIIGSLGTLQEYQDKLPKQEREELHQSALEESHRLHRYIENLLQTTKLHQGIKFNGVSQAFLPIVNNVIKLFESESVRLERVDSIKNITASGKRMLALSVDKTLTYYPDDTCASVAVPLPSAIHRIAAIRYLIFPVRPSL